MTLPPVLCAWARRWLLQELRELAGVGLRVVAIAVVQQDVRLLRLRRELTKLRRPRLELFLGVEVAEPLVDVSAVPLVAVPVEAHDGEVPRGGGDDRRHR